MKAGNHDAIIGTDMVIEGEVTNGDRVDVYGYIDGLLAARHVVVHPGGRVFGALTADKAEIAGTVQGKIQARQLISILSTGVVLGDVRYGALALEAGGELSAVVRNVPPEISGDLDLVVTRGRSIVITPVDLVALDPDDDPDALTYMVSNANCGFVALDSAPDQPAPKFTQADVDTGRVRFVHDGSSAATAAFNVVVTDAEGANSGAPQTVNVAVRDSP